MTNSKTDSPQVRSLPVRWRDSWQFRRLIRVAAAGQDGRASQFAALPPVPGAVVFLGDSITEAGIWPEWFADVQVLNRGIGGDTTSQILRRIDTAIHEPSAVFLLAGTNDLHSGSRPEAVAERIRAIVDAILDLAPDASIYLQSIMPRGANFAGEIAETNELSRAFAATRTTVHYLDLWPALADPHNALRAELTFDGLHLNGRGYTTWVEVLRPLVSRHRQAAARQPAAE